MAPGCTLIFCASALLVGSGAAADRSDGPAWDDLDPPRPAAGDWPWWRGPDSNNIAREPQDPPIRWSETDNVIWKVEIPGRGYSSPCIWGQRIFLTTADDRAQIQYALCYDRSDGRKLWQKEVHRGGFVRLNPKNSHASSTPACDGTRVFLPFVIQGAAWLTALDLDGGILWQKRLGDFVSMHGYAASPVIYRSLVIIASDSVKGSFLAAVHRRTGEVIWRVDRPDYELGTYASPVAGRVAGRDQLLLHGPFKVFSYDPVTGGLLWTCDGPSESASSTVTLGERAVFSSAGYPERNLLCIRADGRGDVSSTHILWKKEKKMAYVPSPLLADGLLYMAADEGEVSCFDAESGLIVWRTELDGKFSSSPVLAGGRIHLVDEAGVTYIFKAGRTFEMLGRNDLAGGGFASPVICGGRIYLRTFHRLYCLGKADGRP